MESVAKRIEANVERACAELKRCRNEIAKRLVGQEQMVDGMLTGLIAGGHVLLEGVPGLAKTLAVKTLAEVLDAEFKTAPVYPGPAAGGPGGNDDLQAAGPESSLPARDRSSPISSSPTRLTGLPPRCSRPCWKRWRSGTLP